MSDAYIYLPHYEQSASGYCLPTCARMVLARIGLAYSEAELSQVLGTDEVGTPSFAVTKLSQVRLDVDYRNPILSTGPTAVSWDGMLAAWFEFAYRGATLQRKKRFSLVDWVRKGINRD